jgi:hypothetical protein
MIGPTKVKMPDKEICLGCDVLISKELGGTEKFPTGWTAFYCTHSDLKTFRAQVAFIKRNKPWTPKWCPAKWTEPR